MSLFSSIQMASGALQASQVGLQVVGQNISNANTPGYIRESVNYTAGPTVQQGSVLEGTGVQVQSITQNIDQFLEQRLRSAGSDKTGADTVKQTYSQLESVVGALDNTNSLSTSLNSFFSSIANISSQPQSTSVRNLAALQGQSLTKSINQLYGDVGQLRSDTNAQIDSMATNINNLVTQIGKLNTQILGLGANSSSGSDAVGLTDQRDQALTSLSQLISIRTSVQPDGSVSVYSGNEYLVAEGNTQSVETVHSSNRGTTVSNLEIAGINVPLDTSSGQLGGLVQSRDTVLGGFQDQLDTVAGTLLNDFNQIYSSGQGLDGYTQITSQNAVTSASQQLDRAGLQTAPTTGSFQIVVTDTQANTSTTTNVPITISSSGKGTTLTSLAAQINAVSGLSATVKNGQLTIATTGANTQFSFANDTSGTLTALGLNTFFTGTGAADIAVNSDVLNDPSKFAASTSGIGADATNATALSNFRNTALSSQNGSTLDSVYSNVMDGLSSASATATSTASAADTFQSTLSNQELSVSGVSIDDEAVQLMQYQQSYEAAAKYITTLNNLFTILDQMVIT